MTVIDKPNVDNEEIERFNQFADRWWDPESEFKLLHQMNPLRLQFIDERAFIHDKRVLDIGCGGGILSESMANLGAEVVGIDQSEKLLKVAKAHAEKSKLKIKYEHITAEQLAEQVQTKKTKPFEVITCLEMLEHVPDPKEIVKATSSMVSSGGSIFFSTINRTAKAYVLAILGAEYVMGLLPKGTHDYAKFIRPSELAAWCRQSGIEVKSITGMHYNPLSGHFSLGDGVGVNYLIHAVKS